MSVGVKMLKQMRHQMEAKGGAPTWAQSVKIALQEEPIQVEADVSAYDTLGVALRGLRVRGDSDAPLEKLAQAIGERVTYLWEPLALIEQDLERERVQMRSAPPLIEDGAIEFYAGDLTRQAVRLTRYRQESGQRRRDRVAITLTHEIFRRLVDDLAGILHTPARE